MNNRDTHHWVTLDGEDYSCNDCDTSIGRDPCPGTEGATMYGATNREARLRTKANYWTSDHAELMAFARDIVKSGYVETPDRLLEFFQAPHYWHAEHEWWVEAGRPDHINDWDRGHETGFPADPDSRKPLATERLAAACGFCFTYEDHTEECQQQRVSA